MEILHQYYYRKGPVVVKAVTYVLLSVLFVFLGVFCFNRWDLSFLFSDWKGWLIVGVYGLITLGTILSTFATFRKIGKLNNNIPALAVCEDRFVVYDGKGLPTTILFEDCDKVRFKTNIKYRGAPPTLTLIIKYHNKMEVETPENVDIDLSELDCPQKEIDKQLNKVYIKYKAANA